MYYSLFTLRPHGDVTKFELEDGVIRSTATALIEESSSITEIRVDVPREKVEVGIDVPGATDHTLIAISAESESDVMPDLAPLVNNFAMIVAVGRVDRLEIAAQDGTWSGTATPGTAVRLRADAAPGISIADLTSFATDALNDCARTFPTIGIQALVAANEATSLSTVNVLFTFPPGLDPTDLINPRTAAPIVGSELLDSNSLFANQVTEHCIAPKNQEWT